MTRSVRTARLRRRRTLAALLAVALVSVAVTEPRAASPDVVISQVYGGGGNAGAQYRNDFVELFNRGVTPIPLTAGRSSTPAPRAPAPSRATSRR